ncbi:uncharacterized protein LOC119189210 [Manduca sexta]|uniref:uncharacterized protein LOC119189210 n=1 Tax=Manduca sexta TaxID=7130 RepID=UPI00188F4B99|nr:uncharacterized protein LOC119189210 [Manduca sexta]
MGKRNHPSSNNMDDYYECIEKKVKKLNDMLMRARYKRTLSLSSDSSSSDSESAGSSSQLRSRAHELSSPAPLCIQDVPIQASESAVPYAVTEPLPSTSATVEPHPSTSCVEDPQPSTSATVTSPLHHASAELVTNS